LKNKTENKPHSKQGFKMKIVFLGSGQFGIDCLNALADSPHSLELIVTQPALPAGRGQQTRKTPVASWAEKHSFKCLEAENVNTPEFIDIIAACKPDLIVVIAFGQKISNLLIEKAAHRAINVHSSLLPKYRGAAPINWAVINGENVTGVSIITLAEKMDAGDILAQAQTQINLDETAGALHDRLAKIAAPLLIQTINQIATGKAVYIKQDHSKATLAPKLKKSDGFLDFSQPAQNIHKKILGLSPWPGASANYISKKTGKSCRITIIQAHLVSQLQQKNLPYGMLDEDLNVVCGDGRAVKILKIKPAGKEDMDFTDFVNGRHTRTGDMFTKIDQDDTR
jgi:methionyl-tRNA formyltransferase